MKQIGCVVTAAGTSTRFGANKLLTPLWGKPLLMHTLEKLASLPLARVAVVSAHSQVREMSKEMHFSALIPQGPSRNDTVRTGVQAMADMDGCLFCVGDQPLCSPQSLLALLTAFAEHPESICRLYSGEQPGNPVLFPAMFFSELEQLPHEKGGSWLVSQYPNHLRIVQAGNPFELMDVDTPAQLAELERHPHA